MVSRLASRDDARRRGARADGFGSSAAARSPVTMPLPACEPASTAENFPRCGRRTEPGSCRKKPPAGSVTVLSRNASAADAPPMTAMAEKFDALVIGGGPGGATAALLLARADWKVAVIEKAHFPRRKVCGEYVSATNLPLFRQLGIEADFQKVAGPPVNQVGLFARETIVSAPMPRMSESPDGWGPALGRETLDALLLDRAAEAGAHVGQPWWATKLRRGGGAFVCESTNTETGAANELQASVVIAAHGSWEPGALPTQPARDRKSTRLNSSHGYISYAVLCLTNKT